MTSKATGELLIMAVGDVLVNRPDPPSVFAHVASVLRQGDIVVGTLEGPVCDRGTPIVGKIEVGSRHLRSAPHNIQALESAGFNAMVLANNHGMDYGPQGLLQSIELLDKLNIAHAGGGRNLEEAHRPAIVERNGVRVAILSYTSLYLPYGEAAEENKPGLATVKIHTSYQAPDNVLYTPGFPPLITTTPDPVEMERMVADVRQAKQQADIVLVAFHWGISLNYNRMVGYQKELGRAAIDAGADLILGGHPHVLQGMEMYKGRLICYCLGNFVMDGLKLPHFGSDSMILKCHVRGKQIKKCSFIPLRISDEWQPFILDREKGMEIMKHVESMSTDFGTIFTMGDGEVLISGPKPGTPEARRGLSVEPHRGLPVLVDTLLHPPYIKVQGAHK